MKRPHDHQASRITFVGTLPPPVTGMTLLTARVANRLQEAGQVTLLDWSSGLSRKGLRFRFARMVRVLRSLVTLLCRGPVRNARLYLVANSSWGLYLTGVFAFCAGRLGYRVYLHHHVYSYIDRYDWRMAWIDRCMTGNGVHVVHCDQMIEDFRRRYHSVCRFAVVFPSVVSIPLAKPHFSAHRPFRLGLLSNLTISKGLDLAIDTFNQLAASGQQVRLDLAGPVQSRQAKRLLREALAAHPASVRYWGPLFDEEKVRFFSNLDAFLFPTKYRNESWGIVLHEAMAAGVPVITYDRGCTRTAVGEHAGLVIERDADFTSIAAAQIQKWIDREDEYRAASQAAIDQAEFLQREGARTLDKFVAEMFSPADFP
jgi:glycosyltransferase involved in cell wall biosynthesis